MIEEEKLIKEQWDKLPAELRAAIESVPWKNLVKEIGQTNTLSAEQVSVLERETMFILYGFENPADYPSNIGRELGISEEQALTVAEAVAKKIFEPISQKTGTGTKSGNNLPAVEEGERVHDVPHVEAAPQSQPQPSQPPQTGAQPKVVTPLPDYRYPDGTDPYREPLK